MPKIEVRTGPLLWSKTEWNSLEDAVYAHVFRTSDGGSADQRLVGMLSRLLESAAPVLGIAMVADVLEVPVNRVRYVIDGD